MLSAYRWWLLLRLDGADIGIGDVIRVTFLSGFVGMLVPGGVGVEIARVVGMKRFTETIGGAVVSVLIDRLLGVVGLVFIVLAGLLAAPVSLPPTLATWALVVLVGSALSLGTLLHGGTRRRLVRRLPAAVRPRLARFGSVSASLARYGSRPGRILGIGALVLSAQGLRVLTAVTAALALGIEVEMIYFAIIMPIVIFAALIPVSMSELGVREVTFVYMLGLLGVPAEGAFALSVLLFVLTTLSLTPGAWWLARARD